MTSLQGWLSHIGIGRRDVKDAAGSDCRGLATETPTKVDEPQLMGRGLERC